MRAYIAPPDLTREPDSDIPLFRVTAATNVCATEAYTIAIPDKANRYINLISFTLTDDECDVLIEALQSARAERLRQQEQTYETLHAKFGGTWDNEPVVPLELATDDE